MIRSGAWVWSSYSQRLVWVRHDWSVVAVVAVLVAVAAALAVLVMAIALARRQ